MDADQVINDIRSCLISSKGGVPISQINKEYKMIIGQSIPYTRLGYTTLDQFLRSIPGLNVYPRDGDLVLEALPTKNTSHITAMVRGQKSSGPRRKIAPPSYGMRNLRGYRTPLTMPPRRIVPEPMTKVKRPTPAPSYLPSLSRSNLPPRLKALQPAAQATPTLGQLPSATSTVAGPRKVQEVLFNLDSQPLYQSEGGSNDHHLVGPSGDATTGAVTVPDPSAWASASVLRTPTGVLGKKSPGALPEYRRHTSEGLDPTPLMSVAFPPLVPPRTNAQARLSRQVSLPPIRLDTDIKMTPLSPSYTYRTDAKQVVSPGVVAAESQASSGYCKMLQVYCRAKHLPEPVYKIIPSFPKSKTKQIVCSIKVGVDHQFSSYPAECKTEEEAREVAAQDAVASLERIHGVLGESLPVTIDESILVARISQMVHDHPNGLWSLQLPADYRNLYREILPNGWLEVVRSSPLITIDRAVHDRIILLPNRATSSSSNKGRVTPTSASPVDLAMSSLTVTEVPEWKVAVEPAVTNGEAVRGGEVTSLGQIKLPEDEYWNVFVTYATSTSNVWVRLIGEEYSALYDDMAAEMELFYMDGGVVAKNLIPGHFYALQVDKCWHRVEIIELRSGEESDEKGVRSASCFFVDNGDDDDAIEVHKFRLLDAVFTKLPCQAVQCRLTGLEDFSLEVVESVLLEKIIGHNFVAKPAAGSLEEDGYERPYPSLTLYDTSTDENVNLNEVLLEKVVSDTVPPALLKNGKIQEVFVPFIAKSGALYVQLPSNIFDYVSKAIDEFSSNINVDGEHSSGKITAGVTAVFEEMMYLARYEEDMLWYRAVKDANNPGVGEAKVWVKFVDYGNRELTSLKDLILLPPSHPLSRLPAQAIECRLNSMPMDLHFSEKGLKRVREIVTPEEPVLLKVVSALTDTAGRKCDVVEIFKRVQPANLLASVSTTLSVEVGAFERKELACDDPSPKSPSASLKGPARSPSLPLEPVKPRGLPAPRVPRVGELFDVHVTIAANPGNFTVQPWRDAEKFNQLMGAMQSVYSASSPINCSVTPEEAAMYRMPLVRSQVKEGGVFAALHDDKQWYRVSVSKLIEGPCPEEVMVSAYFVDYGDVAVVTLDRLRELAPEFYSVPYQAVKAKLSGILPVHSDWSVEDCLRFQEMVCNKQFVATVVETGPDIIDPSDTVIGINLTDTSDPTVDASIGEIFLEEGRARPSEEGESRGGGLSRW